MHGTVKLLCPNLFEAAVSGFCCKLSTSLCFLQCCGMNDSLVLMAELSETEESVVFTQQQWQQIAIILDGFTIL